MRAANGAAQRDEMQTACNSLNLGMAELPDRLVFFNGDIVGDDEPDTCTYNMSKHTAELKKETAHFAKLRPAEADKELEERFPWEEDASGA
jgi:hypothetical protein